MERRAFIHLSAYTAIALTLPALNGCTSTDKILEQPSFFAHIADEKTIIETGQSYRKLFPSENDQIKLKQLLLGNNQNTDKKLIQNTLDSNVTLDFKSGNLVTAAGWVLSITEARQCALYSILNT